jgi:hypothetical protein
MIEAYVVSEATTTLYRRPHGDLTKSFRPNIKSSRKRASIV